MPTDNFKILNQVQLSDSATTVYGAVPANHETIVKSIHVVNNRTESAVTVNLFIADGATTSTEATTILPPVSMAAGSFAIFEGTITMEVGDYIRGIAGTASEITVTVFGDEIDVS